MSLNSRQPTGTYKKVFRTRSDTNQLANTDVHTGPCIKTEIILHIFNVLTDQTNDYFIQRQLTLLQIHIFTIYITKIKPMYIH